MKRNSTFCFLLLLVVAVGCSGSGQFPIAKTTGTVKCDGEPVPNAIVYFEPITTGDSAFVGQQGFGLTDANGSFQISTYGTNDGAVVGKHFVRVGNSETSPPCNCSLNAINVLQEVEIKSTEPHSFDLVLKKKGRNEKAPVTED
jgi:hypothetical protein